MMIAADSRDELHSAGGIKGEMMGEHGGDLFGRVVTVALACLVACTLGWPVAGSAVANHSIIEEDASPLSGGDGVAASFGDASSQEEASAALDERETDAIELGYVPGEIVVFYEEDATDAQRARALEAVEGVEQSEVVEFDGGALAAVDISDDLTVEAAADIVEEDAAVKYAVPNYLAELYDEPGAETLSSISGLNASDYQKYQWYLDYIDAPKAWEDLEHNGPVDKKVKVAVVDTGASLSHPDLKSVVNLSESIEVVWTNATDYSTWRTAPLRGDGYTNGGDTIEDRSSHGTHVSGIIAARSDNGGIVGVASGGDTLNANQVVDLVVIDAFSLYRLQSNGKWAASANLYDIVFALDYAAKQGCKVANLSLGFTATDQQLNSLMEEITTELTTRDDMVIVAAAGNEGATAPCVPAMCSNVMGVASVNQAGARSSFSNYGAWCSIAAPGESILSSIFADGGTDAYGYMSGTSMACPVVAATAAMVRAVHPGLTARQVREVICATAKELPSSTGLGSGIVNAAGAVEAAIAAKRPGWIHADGLWRYVGRDEKFVVGWAFLGGSWFYFDEAGVMQTGWQKIDGDWFYMDPSGRMKTGWQSIAGRWYYMNSSGRMQTGWLYEGGSWFYLEGGGVMQTGWQKIGGDWFHMDSSGRMQTGWQLIAGRWYYLNSSGRMQTGWLYEGGSWFYLEGGGVMQTGWQWIGRDCYYFNVSGRMAVDCWIGNYYVSRSGAMATNMWIGRYHVNENGLWDRTK